MELRIWKTCSPSGAVAYLSGHTCARLSREELHRWRKAPGLLGSRPMPASLLRHSDDLTLAALHGLQPVLPDISPVSFENWGVVVGARQFGRSAQAQASERFRQEGAWGISPHMIPHASVHAPSGTISLALGLHGPNLGVGNGPGFVTEAFLAAAALLHGTATPGILVVVTEFAPEFIPSPTQATPGDDDLLNVLALALQSEPQDNLPAMSWHLDATSTKDGFASITQVEAFLADRMDRKQLSLGAGLVLGRERTRRMAA